MINIKENASDVKKAIKNMVQWELCIVIMITDIIT